MYSAASFSARLWAAARRKVAQDNSHTLDFALGSILDLGLGMTGSMLGGPIGAIPGLGRGNMAEGLVEKRRGHGSSSAD